MKKTDCGLLTAENGAIIVTPFTELQIEWEQVSESFRDSFLNVFQDAYSILGSGYDVAKGLQSMTVLERIGNLINAQKLTCDDNFGLIWEQETEFVLEELEIA